MNDLSNNKIDPNLPAGLLNLRGINTYNWFAR